MIIGLCGQKGSGKSEVARILVQNHGFTELAFADPLKEALVSVFGFSAEQLYGNLKETVDPYWNVTPREVLQVVGTELFRDALPRFIPSLDHVWLRAMHKRLKELAGQNIVVSDIRFPDELALVLGTIWRVDRPSGDNPSATQFTSHATEQLVCSNPSAIVNNDGPLADLERKVDTIYEAQRQPM